MINFYINPDTLGENIIDDYIFFNNLLENTESSYYYQQSKQLPNLFQQESSSSLNKKYPSLLDSVIQLTNTNNLIQDKEIIFYIELASFIEKASPDKNIENSKLSLPQNNKTKDNYRDLLSQNNNISVEQSNNNKANYKQNNNNNQKVFDKLFEELDSKNGISLSSKKNSSSINNNFQNIYEEKSATEIDVYQLPNNQQNQEIAAILTSDNFGFDSNYQTRGNFEFSPFSIILITLVPGIIAIQQKNLIAGVLFGENGISDQILNSLGLKKSKVSETAIFLHNRAVNDANLLAQLAQAVDNEKFSKHEFLLFAKIKFCLHYNQNEYQGLKENIELFKDAIKVQKSYQTISQIESMCQGIKQQEFYNYVYQEMKYIDDLKIFQEKINHKLSQILPHVKTEEGKYNLQNYTQELGYVCQNQFMFNLFSLFSQKQLEKFLILKSIAEVTHPLKGKDIIDFKALTCLVMVHYDDFEALGEMINITGKKSSPDTYARIIQYIILEERHQQSYDKFEQLMNAMRQWYPYYQSIIGIRDEYSQKEYSIPKEFTQEIPGIELYRKYKNYLTDQKTGYTYVDFAQEMSTIPA
ncbi:MAG: hypothetical protein QNJ64_14915 [Crocosphaera sp.]|nr:hypothetical protein [Crocosphaera sp.]